MKAAILASGLLISGTIGLVAAFFLNDSKAIAVLMFGAAMMLCAVILMHLAKIEDE